MAVRLGDIAPNFSATTTEGLIDSLQLTVNHKVATPADWKQGQDCIVVPAMSDTEAEKSILNGVRKVKPYLRYTSQPNV
jgi:thioredoxin-dependent peroxiredoxin